MLAAVLLYRKVKTSAVNEDYRSYGLQGDKTMKVMIIYAIHNGQLVEITSG